MMVIGRYREEVGDKRVNKYYMDEYYPSKVNKEIMSLYDLIILKILAHFNKVNKVIKEELELLS